MIFTKALETHLKQESKMNDHPDPIKCADDTQQITIHLPCRLAERVDRYATENGSTLTNVVIEALDQFLRGRKVV